MGIGEAALWTMVGGGTVAGLVSLSATIAALRRRRADAAREWHTSLRERRRVHSLRRCADAGDDDAAWDLVELLREQGNPDEAAAVLRRRAAAGDRYAAQELAELLREQGNPDEAAAVLGHSADAAAARERERLHGGPPTIDGLRRRAADRNQTAALELAKLLGRRGTADDLDELRRRADYDSYAIDWLSARSLREQGNVDELCRRVDGGAASPGDAARCELARLLRERGDVNELRRRAARDLYAASELSVLLSERGKSVAEFHRRADAGDRDAARKLAELLRTRGDVGALSRRAAAGDGDAARELARLLRERGKSGELRRCAAAGDADAARELARLLRERGHATDVRRGNIDELRRRADAGDPYAARELARWLREQGNVNELRQRAATCDWDAAWELAELLREPGTLGNAPEAGVERVRDHLRRTYHAQQRQPK